MLREKKVSQFAGCCAQITVLWGNPSHTVSIKLCIRFAQYVKVLRNSIIYSLAKVAMVTIFIFSSIEHLKCKELHSNLFIMLTDLFIYSIFTKPCWLYYILTNLTFIAAWLKFYCCYAWCLQLLFVSVKLKVFTLCFNIICRGLYWGLFTSIINVCPF